MAFVLLGLNGGLDVFLALLETDYLRVLALDISHDPSLQIGLYLQLLLYLSQLTGHLAPILLNFQGQCVFL